MSAGAPSACARCRDRRWLIEQLGALLDYQRSHPERLVELLALDSGQLIEAVGGRRRAELRAGPQAASCPTPSAGAWEVCPHHDGYPPRALPLANAPLLSVRGASLSALTATPAVAFVGTGAPSSYGMEMAGALARGVAAAGVGVVAGLEGTVGRCALAGAVRGRGCGVAVSGDGLEVAAGGPARALLADLDASGGLLVSEQSAQARGRSWGALAALRLVVALADVVVLVEARAASAADMLGARLARDMGRPLAALPGLLTNPLAGGPLQELADGALLLRGPEDLLDLLHLSAPAAPPPPPLRRELAMLLERLGAGVDTVAGLLDGSHSVAGTLAGLGELEALGLIRRLPQGRYQAVAPAARMRRASGESRGPKGS